MKFICDMCKYESNNAENNCPVCNADITHWVESDIYYIKEISDNDELLNAMMNLKKENIIEYELKMSQIKMQVDKSNGKINILTSAPSSSIPSPTPVQPNQPHCPYCNSTNLTKVSGTSRFASTLMFGIGSKKIGKQWKCNNCKSYF